VIALISAEDLVPLALADFYLILTREFQRRLDRFRTSARKVNRAAFEVFSGEGQQLLRIFLGDGSRELAGVNELQLARLLGHGRGDLGNTVPD
jgi:hypothetical protein